MRKVVYNLILGIALMAVFPYVLQAQLSPITDVKLTFTSNNGEVFEATATDPDGNGLVVDGPISILESRVYTLEIAVSNSDQSININDEINSDATRYQFFFSTADDHSLIHEIEYADFDSDSLPVGLTTNVEVECFEEMAEVDSLRVVLSDLMDIKSDTSEIADGTSLFDLTWPVTFNEDPDAPPCENEEEIITDVVLTWVPVNGGDTIIARAKDPDGEGPLDLEILDDIELSESTEYTLAIEVRNEIAGEDITEEILEEADEHMFFFAFTDEHFASPAGDGNVDNRTDPVNYDDQDANGLPLGLATTWSTDCGEETIEHEGTFRVILKHQPGVKSESSTVDDGGTDVDLTWTVNINEDPDAPPCENEEEIITDVVLTWVPVNGGDTIIARAQDPDGEGPLDLEILDDIELSESTEYALSIELRNEIAGEDITEEILEEADEHMFFFAFTDEHFASPAGDGNVDNRTDPVNYDDQDANGLPLGLATTWSTDCGEETIEHEGSFQIILKHQPGVKSESSTVEDGGTDLDLTWTVNINEDPDAPPCENEEEIITDVVLTWVPINGVDTIIARAQDPDGEGPLDLEILDDINLVENIEYTLTLELLNEIAGEDITEEIMEEDDEHMFFFAFTEGVFSSPSGDGNVDNRTDTVNYNDFDENNLPVGLSTNWTTAMEMAGGEFQIILKHQPDVKSETSTVDDGGTDLDLTFAINTVVTSSHDFHDEHQQQLVLSPNPVKSTLNWQFESDLNYEDVEILIFDVTGHIFYRDRSQLSQIDVSAMAPGFYILQWRSGENVISKRFIKSE